MTGTTYAIIGFIFFIISFGTVAYSWGVDSVGFDWNEFGGAFILCAFCAFFWPIASILGLILLCFIVSQNS